MSSNKIKKDTPTLRAFSVDRAFFQEVSDLDTLKSVIDLIGFSDVDLLKAPKSVIIKIADFRGDEFAFIEKLQLYGYDVAFADDGLDVQNNSEYPTELQNKQSTVPLTSSPINILEDDVRKPIPPPLPVFYQSGASSEATWEEAKPKIFVGLSLAVLMLSVGYFTLRQSSTKHDAAPAASAVAVVAEREIAMPEPAITPKVVEISQSLKFDSPSECIAAGTLEKVYSKLDSAMESGTSGFSVKLDEYDRPLPVAASSDTDSNGTKTTESSVRFPENTEWNGLKLSRIKASRYNPLDTDSSYTRYITFLDPPEKVMAVLDRLQFRAKMAPDYSELLDTYNSCGGAMQLEAVPGGSSLSCGWGC